MRATVAYMMQHSAHQRYARGVCSQGSMAVVSAVLRSPVCPYKTRPPAHASSFRRHGTAAFLDVVQNMSTRLCRQGRSQPVLPALLDDGLAHQHAAVTMARMLKFSRSLE